MVAIGQIGRTKPRLRRLLGTTTAQRIWSGDCRPCASPDGNDIGVHWFYDSPGSALPMSLAFLSSGATLS